MISFNNVGKTLKEQSTKKQNLRTRENNFFLNLNNFYVISNEYHLINDIASKGWSKSKLRRLNEITSNASNWI